MLFHILCAYAKNTEKNHLKTKLHATQGATTVLSPNYYIGSYVVEGVNSISAPCSSVLKVLRTTKRERRGREAKKISVQQGFPLLFSCASTHFWSPSN